MSPEIGRWVFASIPALVWYALASMVGASHLVALLTSGLVVYLMVGIMLLTEILSKLKRSL